MSYRQITALACVVALGACGNGVQVRTQSSPTFTTQGRSTFRVMAAPRVAEGATLPSDDPMVSNSITNQALRADVTQALESRGYRPASGGTADFDVALYASEHQALDIRRFDYGYTWRGWPREYTEVTPYERGTVIVDLVDPSSHDLLWRGQGVAAVSANPNHFVDQLNAVVNQIVKKLPAANANRANYN